MDELNVAVKQDDEKLIDFRILAEDAPVMLWIACQWR